MKQTTTSDRPSKPNPQALYELEQRVLLFLAMREIKKRAQELKQTSGGKPTTKA